MDFSEPHLDADLGVLVPIDSDIESFEDLKGKVLCTDTGAGSESWLRENLEKWGPYEIQTYDGVSDAFLDVQAGRCDGAVTDDRGVDWYVKDFSDTLKKAMVLGEAYRVGFAFRPGDPLIDTFNEAIRSMKEDGFIAESYKTHYGVYPPENSSAYFIYETPFVPTK
jgi:glutamine transport system substrate-binding protein